MDTITVIFGIFIVLFSIILLMSFFVESSVHIKPTKCRPDISNTEIKNTVRCSATPEYHISDRVPENSYNSSLYPGHQIGTSVNAGSWA
jgi:hypothetical protein